MRLSLALSVVVSFLFALGVSSTISAQEIETFTLTLDEGFIYGQITLDLGSDTYSLSVSGLDEVIYPYSSVSRSQDGFLVPFSDFPITLSGSDFSGTDFDYFIYHPAAIDNSIPVSTVYTVVITAECTTCVPSPPMPGSISDVVTDSFSLIDFIIPNTLLQGLAYFCFLGGSGWLMVKRGIRVLR